MFDVITQGTDVPAVYAIHSFNSADTTKMLNDSSKDISPKGIYSGGRLVTGGRLAVEIEPFAAKTIEGMTLRNDLTNTRVIIPATGKIYMICLYSKYLPSQASYVKTVAIPSTDYEDHPDRAYLICFGMCDLTGGNDIVLPGNLSEIGRDNGPFQENGTLANYSQEVSAILDTFSSSIFDEMAFDGFNTDSMINIDDTTMLFNKTLHCFQAKQRGDKISSINLLPDAYINKILKVAVFVDHNDPAPIIKVRANKGADPQIVTTGQLTTLTMSGSQLYLEFIASTPDSRIYNYLILFNPSTDLEKIDPDSI
ncbi:hypothetical protein [Ewingella americana]|uniref:Uncharacterized protein n=1 Tax=Ewingella americana TaxID=41202 RepID=A0A502GCX7_9GAMM|nr:hypothetical protein [Ewingella americana]TPG60127.1 hypothetical protein EAH77_16290 [Ewingella americana]